MSAAPVFVPVSVDSLVGEAKTEFDLYVQLSTKHVLYLRKGGIFDSDRLAKIREKNVKNLWILGADESLYRSFVERQLDAVYDLQSNMNPLDRAMKIRGSQASAAEALMSKPSDFGAYYAASENAKRLTEFILKNDDGLKTVLSLQLQPAEKTVANHGVSVAALALALAKKLGMGDAKDLHLLALGCLIHDAGHFNQNNSGFGKPVKSLPVAELRVFNEHPMTGVRLTQDQVHFEQHVVKIMLEHEEYADGSGFPKGLNERQMHAYPMIASTANSFDKLITFENEPFPAALKRLFVEKIGRHPLAHLNAMKAIVQQLG